MRSTQAQGTRSCADRIIPQAGGAEALEAA